MNGKGLAKDCHSLGALWELLRMKLPGAVSSGTLDLAGAVLLTL